MENLTSNKSLWIAVSSIQNKNGSYTGIIYDPCVVTKAKRTNYELLYEKFYHLNQDFDGFSFRAHYGVNDLVEDLQNKNLCYYVMLVTHMIAEIEIDDRERFFDHFTKMNQLEKTQDTEWFHP